MELINLDMKINKDPNFAEILRHQLSFYLAEPDFDVLHIPVKLLLVAGFLQLRSCAQARHHSTQRYTLN